MWMFVTAIVMVVFSALLVLIAVLRTGRPTRTLLYSACMGFGALWGIHLLSAATHIATGFGWFTCLSAFLFGAPGVATTLVLNYIFH